MRALFGVAIALALLTVPFQASACHELPPPLDEVRTTLEAMRDDCIEWNGLMPVINYPDCLLA